MTRQTLIERILRHVYGEQPTDDSNITVNLVNVWINDGIGLAVKQNYKDSIQLDGVSYVNNSFYTTYSGLTVSKSVEPFVYKITLPQVPFGIGKNEGVASLRFLMPAGSASPVDVSYDAIPLSANQVGYKTFLPQIPNKIYYWSEGIFIYANTNIPLYTFQAIIRMISGGDSTDLTSVLNVPDDYIPVIIDYCTKQLIAERLVKKDGANDGNDQA